MAKKLAKVHTEDRLLNQVQENVAGVLDHIQAQASSSGLPSGVMLPFGGKTLPGTFLWCDGAAYPIEQYPGLFQAIGTIWNTFNGAADPGAGRFRVPFSGGRTPVGAGQGTGLTSRVLGGAVGAEALPAHTHGVSAVVVGTASNLHHHNASYSNFTAQAGAGANFGDASGSAIAKQTSTEDLTHNHALTGATDSTGTGSHGVMQPSLVVNFIIKI